MRMHAYNALLQSFVSAAMNAGTCSLSLNFSRFPACRLFCPFFFFQATCQEGAGWYVLVLTLSALLCCCCFLTMARKFVAMWHERWWLASGGDLAVPLLDDDGEEQQHEVGYRRRHVYVRCAQYDSNSPLTLTHERLSSTLPILSNVCPCRNTHVWDTNGCLVLDRI